MRAFGLAAAAAALALSGAAHARAPAGTAPVLHVAQAAAPGKQPETRPARPREVRVRVLLIGEKVRNDPDEFVEAHGARYIYFRSPRLKSPARPLNDFQLRYPAGQFEQKDGAVILQLLIDERGAVAGRDVVCAAPPFVKSALESVEGLKFKPAVAKEGPVKSYMLLEFGYGRGFPCARLPE